MKVVVPTIFFFWLMNVTMGDGRNITSDAYQRFDERPKDHQRYDGIPKSHRQQAQISGESKLHSIIVRSSISRGDGDAGGPFDVEGSRGKRGGGSRGGPFVLPYTATNYPTGYRQPTL